MNSVTVLSLFLCCGAAAAGVRYAHYRIKTRRGLLRAWENKKGYTIDLYAQHL